MAQPKPLDQDDRWTEPALPLRMPKAAGSSDERSGRRPKSAPAVAHGPCPGCTGNNVAVVTVDGHLVWRVHYKTTYRGTAMLCRTGGARLCDQPMRQARGIETVSCPCEYRRSG